MKRLTLTAALVVFAGIGTANAAPKMSLPQAVDLCTERAVKFGRIPRGQFADEPPPEMVEQRFRACVFANSHQYPSEPPKYRDSILTTLRDALS